MAGFIYVMSNPAFPDLIKIGKSKKDPTTDRVSELNQTGVAIPAFLRASHIKPWRACETAEERLDPYNGLALAPHLDQLFDQGYITFDTSGSLILSDECPPMIPIQWGFEEKISQSLIEVNSKRGKYIKYHNRHVVKH